MQYCLHLSTYSWDLQVFYSIRQSDWKPSRTGNFHHKDPLKNCAFWYFYKLLKEPRTDYENMFLNIHNKQSRRFSKTPFFFLNTYSKKAVNAYHFWFFCHQTLLWSLKLVPPRSTGRQTLLGTSISLSQGFLSLTSNHHSLLQRPETRGGKQWGLQISILPDVLASQQSSGNEFWWSEQVQWSRHHAVRVFTAFFYR